MDTPHTPHTSPAQRLRQRQRCVVSFLIRNGLLLGVGALCLRAALGAGSVGWWLWVGLILLVAGTHAAQLHSEEQTNNAD
jgi:fatty acid desaturase